MDQKLSANPEQTIYSHCDHPSLLWNMKIQILDLNEAKYLRWHLRIFTFRSVSDYLIQV